MALDLSKLERRHDFDLTTQALGPIRCGTLKAKMLSAVEKLLKNTDGDALVFSRLILGMVGRRDINATENLETLESALTDEDVQQITNDEVEIFAQEFVAHNEWLLHFYDDESRQVSTNEKGEKIVSYSPKVAAFPKGDEERSSHYLIRVLRRYLDEQSCRLKKMMEPVSGLLASSALAEQYKKLVEPISSRLASSMFNDSAVESFRRNLSMSDQLQDTIKAFKQSTLDRDMARSLIEPRLPEFRLPPILESPIVETNKRLGSMLEQMREMRPLVTQSAELIGNMNDTALKMQASFMNNARSTQMYALLAIGIAVVSLLVSSFFSWLSYSDARQQSDKNDTQIKLFQDEIRNLIAAQENDRAALVSVLKDVHRSSPAKREVSSSPSVAEPKERGSKFNSAP